MLSRQLKSLELAVPCIGLLLSSCAPVVHRHSTMSAHSLEGRSNYDFLTYMEPQDSFEFVRSRLTSSIANNRIRLSAEDHAAIRDFTSGVIVEGQAPLLQMGRCNQLTAVLQAVLCCLPSAENKAAYLTPDNITGFYDQNFEKGLIDFLTTSGNTQSSKEVMDSGLVSPQIVQLLYSEAVRQRIIIR